MFTKLKELFSLIVKLDSLLGLRRSNGPFCGRPAQAVPKTFDDVVVLLLIFLQGNWHQ